MFCTLEKIIADKYWERDAVVVFVHPIEFDDMPLGDPYFDASLLVSDDEEQPIAAPSEVPATKVPNVEKQEKDEDEEIQDEQIQDDGLRMTKQQLQALQNGDAIVLEIVMGMTPQDLEQWIKSTGLDFTSTFVYE